jgi:hypothetical protein
MSQRYTVTFALACFIAGCASYPALAGQIGTGTVANGGNITFGGNHGSVPGSRGSAFQAHGSEFRGPGDRMGDRSWRGYRTGVYPNVIIDTPYLGFDDDESNCGFVWMDRIFRQRIIRQRVYTCS